MHSPDTSAGPDNELLPLGNNWFIHNPELRTVRLRYEAIPANHCDLPVAEGDERTVVSILLQTNTSEAAVVPCLYQPTINVRSNYSAEAVGDPVAILHLTIPERDMQQLDAARHTPTRVPVHVYIGDPLASTTPFDAYNPHKLTLSDRLEPGDPLFCTATERVVVFGAYMHSAEEDAVFGITAGQAVQRDAGFAPHPRLQPRKKHQRRARSSQIALQCLGTTLSSPSPYIVEKAIDMLDESLGSYVGASGDAMLSQRLQARKQQHDAELAVLHDALTHPHDLDVGLACAAEATIRPCNESGHSQASTSSPGPEHMHLLSWALIRMARKSGDNALTLHAYPGDLRSGAAVTMTVHDPHLERPLGPYRDGVVNGAPASIIIRGHLAREWAVFPARGRKGLRFACRGDAGALLMSVVPDESEGRPRPLAMLYAAPERGPYGLVTPLTTILHRIRDITGMQLRFQGRWWRDSYS